MLAGVEYAAGKPNKGTKWHRLSLRRMNELVKANTAREDQDFIFFDTLTGKQERVRWRQGKKLEENGLIKQFDPVTSADYDGKEYAAEGKDTISMPYVLDYLRELGRSSTHAGTVREVSIFSHAWTLGPILVNSYDDHSTAETRDEDDKDGRWFDFQPPNMSEAERQELQQAFHAQGFCWIWGCSFPPFIFDFLARVLRSSQYKKTGLQAKDSLTLTRIQEHCYVEGTYLERTYPKKPSTLTLTFGDIKKHLCEIIGWSYSQLLANATQCPVRGAAMGTYTVFEDGKNLLEVEPKMHAYTQFSLTYFDQKATDRGYVIYSPNYRCP